MDTKNPDDKQSHDMLNKLRAAVLGANDGIVSTAAIIMGIQGASGEIGPIFTAGLAALVAGATSMAVGEYVSVSSQSDAEKAAQKRGDKPSDEHIVSPWHAAIASFGAFAVGGLIPFIAALLSPDNTRVLVTGVAVLIALGLTGYLSATVGQASRKRAIARVVIGGFLAMAITYVVGLLFGTSIA